MIMAEMPDEVKQKIALSVDEEIFWAIANLIQAEEHLLQTLREVDGPIARQIGELIAFARSNRVKLMKQVGISNPAGELWCAAKHVISAAYRLMEAGEKCVTHYKDLAKAKELIKMARGLEEVILLGYINLIKEMGLQKEAEIHEKSPAQD